MMIHTAQELKRDMGMLVVKRGECFGFFLGHGAPSRIFWRMGLLAMSSLTFFSTNSPILRDTEGLVLRAKFNVFLDLRTIGKIEFRRAVPCARIAEMHERSELAR